MWVAALNPSEAAHGWQARRSGHVAKTLADQVPIHKRPYREGRVDGRDRDVAFLLVLVLGKDRHEGPDREEDPPPRLHLLASLGCDVSPVGLRLPRVCDDGRPPGLKVRLDA